MKYLPITALQLRAAVPSYAQQQDLTLKVTPTEADSIWKGLRKLPVEEVETVMAKIREQVTVQTTPKPVEAPKGPEKK